MKASIVVAALTCMLMSWPAQAGRDIPEAWPDWLKRDMKRESNKKVRKVTLGNMQSRLPGKQTIKAAIEDGAWHVGTDIGGDKELICFVHPEEVSLAALVTAQAEFDIETVAEANNATIESTIPYHIDAGVVAGSPYLGIEFIYHVKADTALIGYVKIWAAMVNGRMLMCKHNEVGFAETTLAAFKTFVTAFSNPDAPASPYFDETFLASIDDQRIGIARSRFYREEHGGKKYVKIELDQAMLVAADSTSVNALDNYDVIWSTVAGELIGAYSTTTTDGNTATTLELQQHDDQWQISGKFEGKDLEKLLSGETAPVTPLGEYRLLRLAMKHESPEPISYVSWIPSVNPVELLETQFERTDASTGSITLGPITSNATFDENGMIIQTVTDMAGTQMILKRVHEAGGID